ncbi:hypothetical protein [Thermoanaerobacterium thermosaccharolyticum]|uniref:hypothetical protein n=1 Tax=Thermoanaerobacterium thermosaccharolyticum TaxID=1517 RepID=UPI0017862705|nr:hypothetical protein [Thermoanaerobacterium thermosaccharolyticum]MBE0069814.1 hypothetical protein [Thermoanaerobacterium thermosaccharolyticum]MBE0227522.1 hypothetical protein [Thermoanaerobacterium thermosaccharolyticum]
MSEKIIPLREKLMIISNDFIEALILNQMLYWTERVNDYEQYIKEEKERIENYTTIISQDTSTLTHGWIYKKAKELKEELMNLTSEDTINRRLNNLVKKGFLYRRNNPIIKYDRTYQYRVNFKNISTALIKKGCILQNEDYQRNKKDWIDLFNLCKTVFETCNQQNTKCNTNPQIAEWKPQKVECNIESQVENRNTKQPKQAILANPQIAESKPHPADTIPKTTNKDYPLPDSVSLSSRSSDNKLVTRSKISLQDQSVLCSDTKIDNLSTYNTPKDTVCILDNNKRDISLNKALDIEHIKPEISLKVPVIEPDISFKELDKEPDKEPVNKPVLSTVTMLEDKTGKILNSNLNKPIDELDIEPEMSFDVPDSELDISTIESEEDAYAILVRDGFIDPSDPDDPFRDLLKNMPPHVEYTEEELEEILKKLNAGSSLNASCSEKKSNFERSGKILNNEQNKPKKDLFKPFSFDDFFGTSDNENLKVAPDISRVLASKKQNNTSESETGKNLNNSLNKPEKDINNASDMPDDTLSEPDNVSVDDSDDDFFKLDDGLFESEEYKEFFAMLDAMSELENARETSLETSHSDPDKEPETSLNAPEREPERNVIMPDADLIELENKPAGMDAEQTLQDSTDLQECLYAEDTSSFTSAVGKIDCNTDSHVLHVLDKADVNKVQDNQNADSNADLMLHHTTTEQGFESVPEGEEVNYGYGNWNDYSLEETDDDGTIISSGQFVQDCDAFEDFDGDWKMLEEYGFTVIDEENSTKAQVNAQNASEKDCKDSCDAFLSDLSDDVVKILAKDKLSDADIKILEEAGFSVVGELDNTMQPDAKNVPEKHIDSTEHELVRMLEEAFNAKVIDDVESDIDSVLIVPEKHVDNTEQELVKMLENAFNAKVVDDTENDIASVVNGTEKREKLHDVRLTDELDALPESLLSEPEKMLDADKPDEVLVAEVGRNLNEPEKVRIVDHNKLKKVPIDETDSKPDEVRKSKVISLADRRYQKSLRQTDKPEKLLEKTVNRRQSQIAFVNRHTNALQECPSCNADSLTTAVGKRVPCTGFEGLELAVNAGMRKRKNISSGSPPAKEMFRNLLVVSKQKHRNLTFACEGGN